jgi:Putative DNA-binding domain
VPTLLELQNALRRSVVDRDDGEAAAMLAEHVAPNRLDIYRNTFVGSLTKALRLCYPAVHRLVGDDFFEATASVFIVEYPPRSAYLDEYGADFPEFLLRFPPAAGLPYLPEVARLEWAVSRAIHAPDVESLEPTRLTSLAPEDQGRVCFMPHPSVGLVRADYPVDTIWRGVLGGDDAALAALDLDGGPVHLLVQRLAGGVEVLRLDQSAWSFAAELCRGRPLQAALDAAVDIDPIVLLAEHLVARRFIGFTLGGHAGASANDIPGGNSRS